VKVVGQSYPIKLNLSTSQSMITKKQMGTKLPQRLDQFHPIPIRTI
jgi:hypothetical protein